MSILEGEYCFEWTQEYQDQVDEIINHLVKEYPLTIKSVEDAHLEFEVKALIIHAINYSRQLRIGEENKK